MSFAKFKKILNCNYGIIVDMFWQEQFAMWQSGYRGVNLHDTTYSILG